MFSIAKLHCRHVELIEMPRVIPAFKKLDQMLLMSSTRWSRKIKMGEKNVRSFPECIIEDLCSSICCAELEFLNLIHLYTLTHGGANQKLKQTFVFYQWLPKNTCHFYKLNSKIRYQPILAKLLAITIDIPTQRLAMNVLKYIRRNLSRMCWSTWKVHFRLS